MARRIKSLHHNLKDNNVIFHREHRSVKNRTPDSVFKRKTASVLKLRKQELTDREIAEENKQLIAIGRLMR